MLTRILSAVVLLPFFLIVLFLLPVFCSCILASLLAILAAYELLYKTGLVTARGIVVLAMLFAAGIPWLVYTSQPVAFLLFVVFLLAAILFAYGMWHQDSFPFGKIAITLFAGCLLPLLFSAFPAIVGEDKGRYLIVLPFLTAWSADTFAYFAGRAFGKHKLIPHISAKKTVEGAIGGWVGCILSLLVYALILDKSFSLSPSYLSFLLLGVIGAPLSMLGDLSMSLIKRECSLKDFSNLIPGHGGILDRFDSVLFTLPLVWALLCAFPFLG